MELSPFVNAGAAGAIIVVVVLFLRFMQQQRTEDRDERMSERRLWTETLNKQQAQHSAHSDRITRSLDALAEKIAKCPSQED